LLPAFIRVAGNKPDASASKAGESNKKAAIHAAQPGPEELNLIYRTMQAHEKDCANDAQLVEKCERDWFNNGDNERLIQTRVTFLNNYMQEWREQIVRYKYAEKNKPLVYKPLAAPEMTLIADTILKCRKQGDTYKAIIDKCADAWAEENRQALMKEVPVSKVTAATLVDQLFVKFFERSPSTEESNQYSALFQSYLESMSRNLAIEKIIQTLMIRSEFVYRYEFGSGAPDANGRRMMSPRRGSRK